MPERVRIVDGAGTSAAAAAAFLKGNPAITLGNTIHFKLRRHRADFSLSPEDAALLVHEWTHVTQYARRGYGAFAAQYRRDLSHHGFDPAKLYAFHGRQTTFAQETLEGQAEMAGVLTLLGATTSPLVRGSAGRWNAAWLAVVSMVSDRARRRTPTMLLILLLAACQMATTLVVTEDIAGPAVAVKGVDGDANCIRSLSVYPAGDDAAPPLWRVSYAREDACVARIVYGQTPPGFDQDVAPAPLAANARYRFAATGSGINDSADITLAEPFTPPFAAPAGSRSR